MAKNVTPAKELDQKAVVNMMADLESALTAEREEGAKTRSALHKLTKQMQTMAATSSTLKSINVESDRTLAEKSYEELVAFCEEPEIKDRFYILPKYSYCVAKGDATRAVNGIAQPIKPIMINDNSARRYVGPGAEIIQTFLRERGDKKTELRMFTFGEMPIVQNDQAKNGAKFYNVPRIIAGMKTSKHVRLAEGITSFDQLGNNNIICDKDFKACIRTQSEVDRVTREIRAQAAEGNLAKAKDMDDAQVMTGDFSTE